MKTPVHCSHDTEARAALHGIAAYAAQARRTGGLGAVDALGVIEQHARDALNGTTLPTTTEPDRIPAAAPRPPATVISSRALTVERAVELLQDPHGRVGRMPIFDLLAMVRDIGPTGARGLLRDARMTESRFVASIPFQQRLLLAGALRNHTGARL